MQLEELAGLEFAGARAPPRRIRVKSKDIELVDFPLAPPVLAVCRMHWLKAYGVSEAKLASLAQLEKEKKERPNRASSSREVNALAEEEDEYDDYNDL